MKQGIGAPRHVPIGSKAEPAGDRPCVFTRVGRAFAAIPLIILSHLLYGAGFWRGLLTTLQVSEQRKAEVQLERFKELGAAQGAGYANPGQLGS